jgi:hypothetical protein
MSEIARLLLYPVDRNQLPDANKLLKILKDISFIGEPFEAGGGERYLAGEHFFQYLSFLGCSPAIALAPDAGEAIEPGRFCHIMMAEYPEPVARYGLDTVIPRCPSCRQRLEQARERLADWKAGTVQACPACGESISPDQLAWKRTAVFGRFFLEIWNIYPGEAVPADSLLQKISVLTAGEWSYAYIRN